MTCRGVGIKMAALAVALQAKCGELDPLDVADLLARAEQELDAEDQLFRAITDFATQHQLCRFDLPKLAEIGADLNRHVEIACLPSPPDPERSDIHG